MNLSRIEMRLELRMESRYSVPDVKDLENNIVKICTPQDVLELEEQLKNYVIWEKNWNFFFFKVVIL